MNDYSENLLGICAALAVLAAAVIDYLAAVLVFLTLILADLCLHCFPEKEEPGSVLMDDGTPAVQDSHMILPRIVPGYGIFVFQRPDTVFGRPQGPAGSRVIRCNLYPGMERKVIRDSRYRKPVVECLPLPEEKVDCMMGTVLYNLYNIYRIQG